MAVASLRNFAIKDEHDGVLMAESMKWRDGVKVVRARSLDEVMRGPSGTGRATAFDFTGTGSQQTWIGRVTLKPGANTGAHHHGRHEVAVYVIAGHTEIRWGNRLEFSAEVAADDFVYFAPHVPHQELNLSADGAVEFLVVRSDNEKIVVNLDVMPVEKPELIS